MCGQHSVRAIAGHNTDKVHTPSPRREIKISDPGGNVTQAAGLGSRDSTDHPTATDYKFFFRL